MRARTASVLTICALALAGVAVGCGDDDDETTTTTPPPTIGASGASGASGAHGAELDPTEVEKTLRTPVEDALPGAQLNCPDEASGSEIDCDVSGGDASGTITATLKGSELSYKSDLSGGISISGTVPYGP